MKSVQPTRILRSEDHTVVQKDDLLVIEEPLEIRVGYGPKEDRKQRSIAVTMRTPGHDFELATGFLYSEKIIQGFNEVGSIDYCADAGKQEEIENIVRVELVEKYTPDFGTSDRNFYMNSSCGVCGKSSIESVMLNCEVLESTNFTVNTELISSLVSDLTGKQTVFKHTGGLHACGLFDQEGRLIAIREDVGRHNALDKLLGYAVIKGMIPIANSILLLSGRAGFELIQKAGLAGVPIIVAVGAPTSLSVSLAKELNITLIGFLREDTFNIYTGEERLKYKVK